MCKAPFALRRSADAPALLSDTDRENAESGKLLHFVDKIS